MASAASDTASSDIPDGLELELLVEISTEVDAQLPSNESRWIDLLMETYDSKVRLLPAHVSTSRLFHWVRKIAQSRQPGQGTWACFQAICEDAEIELGFEPTFAEDTEPVAAPVRHAHGDRELHARIATHGQVVTEELPELDIRHLEHDAEDTKRGGMHAYSADRQRFASQSRYMLAQHDAQQQALSKSRSGIQNPADKSYEDEAAIARRHLLRKKALVGWRDYTLDSLSRHGHIRQPDHVASSQMENRIANAQTVAMRHARSGRRDTAVQEPSIRETSSKARLLSHPGQLEDITEEATLMANPSARITDMRSTDQRRSDAQASADVLVPSRVPEDPVDAPVMNAEQLLQQARDVKTQLYFDLWRHKAQSKIRIATMQKKRAQEAQAELYFQLCRSRIHERKRKHQAMLQSACEMKADLAFDQWNRQTRLFAVLEDNDRMYAEQYLVKMQAKSEQQAQLHQLAHEYKYQWACEHVWQILVTRKTYMDQSQETIKLVQYYRNAIEPFLAWRSNVKLLQNEKLASAYKEARRCHKIAAVSARLQVWNMKVREQHALLARAQVEVDQLRTLSAATILQDHADKLQRLNLLVPIAREQVALLYADASVGKWRDRARQWRAMKRVAEELQQERKERVASEAFRKWRSLTPMVLEARRNTSRQTVSESGLSDTEQEIELETPKPMLRWKTRLVGTPATPRASPAIHFQDIDRSLSTPKTAPRLSRTAFPGTTPATAMRSGYQATATAPMRDAEVHTPRTAPVARQSRQLGAASSRTPRRARGPLFTDPVFFERLKQVMPEHALLDGQESQR